MRAGITFVFGASLWMLASDLRQAEACSPPWPQEYQLDPAYADDDVAPSPPTNERIYVYREDPDDTSSTCAGQGIIEILFEASDVRTPATMLGFEWRPIAGADESIGLRSGAWDYSRNAVRIFFVNSNQDLDLEVEILTVDKNGNRSAPAYVHVVADGAATDGCAAGGGSGTRGSALLVMLAALAALRCRCARGSRGEWSRRA